jgi:hypothetical protein
MSIVYVLHAPEVRKIKIGVTDNLDRRFAEIQAMSPAMLEIIRRVDDLNMAVEQDVHELCRGHLSHGEWFHEDALPQFDRWVSIVFAAASEVARMLVRYASDSELVDIRNKLIVADAKVVAVALSNLLDRRYGSAA